MDIHAVMKKMAIFMATYTIKTYYHVAITTTIRLKDFTIKRDKISMQTKTSFVNITK